MENIGTLTIYLLVIFRRFDGEEHGKSITLEKVLCTRSEAKEYTLNFKSMNANQGYDSRLIQGEWVYQEKERF